MTTVTSTVIPHAASEDGSVLTVRVDLTQSSPWKKVLDALLADIAAGVYKTGDQIPSTRALAAMYRVGAKSIGHATRALTDHGTLRATSAGTYLVGPAPTEVVVVATAPPARPAPTARRVPVVAARPPAGPAAAPGHGALDWQDDAACRDADPELFFHPNGERGTAREQRVAAAKAVCVTCPVQRRCTSYALTNREQYGTWGGLSEEDRMEIFYPRRREQSSPAA